MARARKGEKMGTATETELRGVRLELPADAHKALRMVAAERETSMAMLCRYAILAMLDDRALLERAWKASARHRESGE